MDTGSPAMLSEWDAATTISQQHKFETLDEYNFELQRGIWREIFRTKASSTLR